MTKYTGPTQDTEDDREDVIDNLNNHKQAMVVRAVFKMKEKARACIAVGGGVFEGRKV